MDLSYANKHMYRRVCLNWRVYIQLGVMVVGVGAESTLTFVSREVMGAISERDL